jgi:hypothetical protein
MVIRSRRMKLTGHVARIRQMKNSHKILVPTPEGKRTTWRAKRGWQDNIKMETGYDGVAYIHVAQWRALVNTVMDIRVQ